MSTNETQIVKPGGKIHAGQALTNIDSSVLCPSGEGISVRHRWTLQSSLDVTLTHGANWRIDDPEDDLIADPNLDGANRNFDSGLVSNSLRAQYRHDDD